MLSRTTSSMTSGLHTASAPSPAQHAKHCIEESIAESASNMRRPRGRPRCSHV
ncbi:unnamed protein product, partial [Musa acuminata subsp. burmannicoides]